MAFSSVSGNNNLPSGNFSPIIYSQKVQKFFRTASVVEAITNTDYAGEIENFGDTVNIIKEPIITVSAYSRGSVVDTQDIADDQIQLVVDQANAFAFKVDDIEERHSHVNFESIASSSGAYALKNEYDKNVIAAMVAGVSSSSPDHLLGADSGSGQEINSTRVQADGTWEMLLTTSQLGSADSRQVVFEMDGQLFSSSDDGQDTQFALSLTSEEESSNLLLIIIIVVVALAVLVGVGAFFFTFEEELDELEESNYSNEQSADPYAWAKSKNVPEIPATTQVAQSIQPVVQQQVQQVQQVAQQTTSSQHPGWIWDAESNQWVPDPNYVPGQN